MAPSKTKTKTTTRANNPTRVIMTRSIHKKKQREAAKEEPDSAKSTCTTTTTTTTTTSNVINEEYCYIKSTCEDDVVCSTPRGKKYTIPKISTCPPAPKKKRLVLSRATAAAATKFFSHPDLDVFFLFSSRNTASLQILESN